MDKLRRIGWAEVMGMILLIRKRTLLYTWLAVCMIGLSAIFLAGSRRAFTPTGAMGQGSSAQTVVIDPGHGGQDGGAVAGVKAWR